MAIDGLFLYGLKKEIEQHALQSRVDKIHQPSKEELMFLLRAQGVSRRLFVCVRSSSPRVYFTDTVYENPAEPPMFCMLLRKHLSGAKLSHIEDTGFERVIILCFDSTNEMGDNVVVKLALEFVGKQTNVVLIGSDGRILDAVRRTDIESDSRVILPGAVYSLPERKEKLDIIKSDINDVISQIRLCNTALSKAILETVDGVSPLISREIATRAKLDVGTLANGVTDDEAKRLYEVFEAVKKYLQNPSPCAIIDENGVPFEFSFMPIIQYGNSVRTADFESFSQLLNNVFAERDRKERIRVFANDLAKFISNIHSRILKKIAVREKELKLSEQGEKLRIFGELLKANLYAIDRNVPYVDVENYYDPELKTVRIPLNTALTPAQNAQKYFKDYKKSCNAATVLGELIDESRAELSYIESVIDELKRASSVMDLNEIRSELIGAGYLRATAAERKRKPSVSKPDEVISDDGYKILIGRNNRQNDQLTLKTASDGDMWFHTKNIPGSHVVVLCGGDELPETTITFAAKLAAKNSRAAESSSVPVDYTRIKYVKKPAGAKPGMVIYKQNKTVYVTPER